MYSIRQHFGHIKQNNYYLFLCMLIEFYRKENKQNLYLCEEFLLLLESMPFQNLWHQATFETYKTTE